MNTLLPCYRKHKNEQHFFKVISDTMMQEIKMIGNNYVVEELEAKLFPDKIFIQQLIEQREPDYQVISKEEYESKLAYCEAHLTLLD